MGAPPASNATPRGLFAPPFKNPPNGCGNLRLLLGNQPRATARDQLPSEALLGDPESPSREWNLPFPPDNANSRMGLSRDPNSEGCRHTRDSRAPPPVRNEPMQAVAAMSLASVLLPGRPAAHGPLLQAAPASKRRRFRARRDRRAGPAVANQRRRKIAGHQPDRSRRRSKPSDRPRTHRRRRPNVDRRREDVDNHHGNRPIPPRSSPRVSILLWDKTLPTTQLRGERRLYADASS